LYFAFLSFAPVSVLGYCSSKLFQEKYMSLKKYPDTKTESEAFVAEVKAIEEWWQTDRQKHIKRFVLFGRDACQRMV
jgi:hypothetical protein